MVDALHEDAVSRLQVITIEPVTEGPRESSSLRSVIVHCVVSVVPRIDDGWLHLPNRAAACLDVQGPNLHRVPRPTV